MLDPSPRLKSCFDLFLLECQSRRLTANTLRFYRGRLSLFVRWCESAGLERVSDVTHHHIRWYLVHLSDSGVSSAYQHRFAKCIKTFFTFCVNDELLPVSPFVKVKIPKLERKKPQPIPPAAIRRILDSCEYERDRAIFLTMLDSGVRASELCSLLIADLNMETGALQVRCGKGQKDRTTFVGAKTRKHIMRYAMLERATWEGCEPMFTLQRGNTAPLTYDGLKQLIRRTRDKTNLKFSAHSFRRTFAINSLRNGMNVYMLAELMGHADISVLREYLSFVDSDLADAHAKFGVVDNL